MNVLFITADQWRGDCLSALDHPCVRTPHLDRLADSGVLFTRHNTMYDPDDVPPPVRAPTPEAEARQHPYLAWHLRHQRGDGIAWDHDSRDNLALDDRDIRQARANYYAMMSEVDAQIGRLLASLRASGEDERTLVVFASDHGEHLGDHWQFSKFSYFDQTFHVPLIVRDPRPGASGGRGRRVSAFTENVDVMPTILEAIGLEVPHPCDGESLAPFIAGDTPARWRREAHFEFDFRDVLGRPGSETLGLAPDQCAMYALRGERYKYVHFTAMPPLFFDLRDDPAELVDRSGDPRYRDCALEYARKMLSWRMNHDERLLANVRLTPEGVIDHRPPRTGAS